MSYNLYSRTNQRIVDGAIVGISLCLAFLIRYEGAVPPYHQYQFWVWLLPVIAGRLLTNSLMGVNRVQWSYIGIGDASRVTRSYVVFSFLLAVARFSLPEQAGVLRLPGSVIAIECMLSLLGAMSIRLIRRYVFEFRSKNANQPNPKGPRRLLLIGAGMMGASAARQLATDSSVQIVGFLDDDPRKLGCTIGGASVVGTTSELTEVVSRERIDSVLVCISPSARGSFNRLIAVLDRLPVSSKFVPTITEILDAKDGLHLALGHSSDQGNSSGVNAAPSRMPTPVKRSEITGKCILITGGAGFIGSTLAERLSKENNVLLLDRFFRDQPFSFTSLRSNPNVEFFESDIVEGAEVDDLARRANIVIHAAAIVGVGRVCTYPRETLETNFSGTSRILKSVEKNSRLDRLIYFSTSEVFGVNSFRVHEESPAAVGPAAEARWSYAIAKLAGEHLVKAYHRQSGMPVVTVRPFNVFGPLRLGSHAILRFVLNALTGNPLEVHGDGSQIRSWCYIEDFCDAIVEMICRPEAIGEDFNIGNPANTVTILQLAREIVELTGGRSSIEFAESPFPDIEIRVPSLVKARRILDFRPKYDLRRGLELTVEWYREHQGFLESKMSRAAVATRNL
jgi:nucleoside-diphosphate-sugar epimerase